MKEKIFTIPINDAFNTPCECPICILEKNLEEKTLEFILGSSSMDSDTRITTNEKGFCRRHFKMLYLNFSSVLGLSLVIDTHIQHQMNLYKKLYEKSIKAIENDAKTKPIANLTQQVTKKHTHTKKYIDETIALLDQLESTCEVCDKINATLENYFDVIFWMYFKDVKFRNKVKSSKGFCLRHYNMLLKSAKIHLSPKQLALFVLDINELMINNMDRILDDVQWFSQKFDYRNEKASWKNSKDAVPRAIEKFISYCDFK